jgi:hypothetical protein
LLCARGHVNARDAEKLDDGAYDVIVVDVDTSRDNDVVRVELTIVSGPHKGAVIAVHAPAFEGDPISLLGIPATLLVEGGRPTVELEP